jgi:hypothetical protein
MRVDAEDVHKLQDTVGNKKNLVIIIIILNIKGA